MKHRQYKATPQLSEVVQRRQDTQASRFARRREIRMDERRKELLGHTEVQNAGKSISSLADALAVAIGTSCPDWEFITMKLKALLSVLELADSSVEGIRKILEILAFLLSNAKKIPIQSLSAWCIANITFHGHDRCIIAADFVPTLLEQLTLSFLPASLQEPCLWSIGNISGCCTQCRTRVQSNGIAVSTLVEILQPKVSNSASCQLSSSSAGCQSIAAWALGNLLRSPRNEEMIRESLQCGVQKGVLAMMKEVPIPSNDVEMDHSTQDFAFSSNRQVEQKYNAAGEAALLTFHICNNLESISSLMSLQKEQLNNSELSFCDLSKEATTIIGCCCGIILQASRFDASLSLPALRLLGSLANHSNSLASLLAKQTSFLQAVHTLMNQNENKVAVRESLFLLTNLSAGELPVRRIIAQNFIPILLRLLAEGEFRIKKQVSFIVTNLVIVEEAQAALFSPGFIAGFIELLSVEDNTTRSAVLYFFHYYLYHCNDAACVLTHLGAFDIIEGLYYKQPGNSNLYEEILRFKDSSANIPS
eukprot:CAMPEP_0206183080 /NCGR_PEP_ID=MMETSP0166-20121206/432_1 /ASSEMBLY_ACC=CAM_ASM_000260 /TAXON_ID=95228 /ORGANISM="Vannella robusta, Strain DIVA3 518/3/11/1/6" /LENGTH=533 /DNA_ID=CAMNT_0053597881 /DNA_START=1588 /DNA_END=3189 /DNA_ORIENTATION=+